MEIEACNSYLKTQIELIGPRIVCPLGTPAVKTIMGPEYSTSRVHGQPFKQGTSIVLPMYHPAAALYDPGLKDQLLQDFRVLKEILEGRNVKNQLLSLNKKATLPEEQPLKQWFQ